MSGKYFTTNPARLVLVISIITFSFPTLQPAFAQTPSQSESVLQALDTLVTQTSGTIAAKPDSEPPRNFFKTRYGGSDSFNIDTRVEQLQLQLSDLRSRMEKVESASSINRLRREIKRITQGPDEVSEITLQNGTIVVGKIISENMDRIIVQTSIGQLTLNRVSIQGIKAQKKPHAVVELKGNYEERLYPDKRGFQGKVINKGLRRADFVRVVFRLHDSKTNIIAQDSTFIQGEDATFLSGVVSESSLNPDKEGAFYLEVHLPSGVDSRNISYVTYKVRFDEFQ